MTDHPDDVRALRDLADRYARTMDDRDAKTLISQFVPGGVLSITGIDTREFVSPAGLEKIIGYMARYTHTFYFVGNHMVDVDGDRATGETYTISYHYQKDADGSQQVVEMPLRYLDTYVRTADGWKFERRDARVLWTERRTIVS